MLDKLKKVGRWLLTGHAVEFDRLPVGYVFDDGYGERYRKTGKSSAKCVTPGSPNYGETEDSFNPAYSCQLVRNTAWGRKKK